MQTGERKTFVIIAFETENYYYYYYYRVDVP